MRKGSEAVARGNDPHDVLRGKLKAALEKDVSLVKDIWEGRFPSSFSLLAKFAKSEIRSPRGATLKMLSTTADEFDLRIKGNAPQRALLGTPPDQKLTQALFSFLSLDDRQMKRCSQLLNGWFYCYRASSGPDLIVKSLLRIEVYDVTSHAIRYTNWARTDPIMQIREIKRELQSA